MYNFWYPAQIALLMLSFFQDNKYYYSKKTFSFEIFSALPYGDLIFWDHLIIYHAGNLSCYYNYGSFDVVLIFALKPT